MDTDYPENSIQQFDLITISRTLQPTEPEYIHQDRQHSRS